MPAVAPLPSPLPRPVTWPEYTPDRRQHGAARRRSHHRRPDPEAPRLRRFDRTPASSWHAPMDFNDSPEEAAWRAECRAWLEANAPSVAGPATDESTMFEAGRSRLPRARPALAGAEVRRRVRAHHVGARVRRPQRHDDAADDLRPGRGAVRRADRGVRDRSRDDRADAARVRHRRAAAALPHEAAARRGDLEPAVQRAGRRLRRRVARR